MAFVAGGTYLQRYGTPCGCKSEHHGAFGGMRLHQIQRVDQDCHSQGRADL